MSGSLLSIRSFRNADIRVLYRVYMAHHAKFGPVLSLSFSQFEQAIFTRVFFDPEQLLIATLADDVVGWCQYFSKPDAPGHVIANLCASTAEGGTSNSTALPSTDEPIINELLQGIIRRTRPLGGLLLAGIVRDDQWGYAGLEPMGAACGVSVNDLRLTNLLQNSGFAIASQHIRCLVSTDRYRAPMNRESLLWRRKCSLQSVSTRPSTTRQAAALSHMDVVTYSLVDRGGQSHASIEVWLSDPEAEVMNPTHAILHQSNTDFQRVIDSALACLIGMTVSDLPRRGIQQVEMVLDESSPQAVETLEKLHFQLADRGTVLVRDFSTEAP